MKISKRAVAFFTIFFIIMVAITVFTLVLPEKTNAGNWADVCCGPKCIGGDHCKGNGTFTCCKTEPVPIE